MRSGRRVADRRGNRRPRRSRGRCGSIAGGGGRCARSGPPGRPSQCHLQAGRRVGSVDHRRVRRRRRPARAHGSAGPDASAAEPAEVSAPAGTRGAAGNRGRRAARLRASPRRLSHAGDLHRSAEQRLAGAPPRCLGPYGGRFQILNATTPLTRITRLAATPDDKDSGSANDESFAPTRALSRLASIDVLRGLIIVIMALDHVRDYFTDVRFNPLDPAHTTAMLYATRWVTNFCAPVFVLLAG